MHQVDMRQLDLHVDILYIPNAFLAHRHDTGTTEKCIDAIRSDTDPKPWILCRGRELSIFLPRQRNAEFSAAAENAGFRVQPFGTGSCYEPVPKVDRPEAPSQPTWRPL